MNQVKKTNPQRGTLKAEMKKRGIGFPFDSYKKDRK